MLTAPGTPRPFHRVEAAMLACVALLYLCMVGRFRTFNIDTPWFVSFSYAWWHMHQPYDLLMLRRFPHGMGGVEAFGKLAAGLQGIVMERIGWQGVYAELLSSVCVSAAVILLADCARRMGRSWQFVVAYVAVVGASEPFVAAAHQTRFEFLTLLLSALALWCGVRNQVFLSAFLAAISMEIQPAACVVFVATAVFLLMPRDGLRPTTQRVMRVFAGLLCAAPVYLSLHPHIASILRHADVAAVAQHAALPGGFAVGYFADGKRHLLYLLFLLAAVTACLRWRRALLKQWPFVAVCCSFALSAAMRWDNPRYFALLMPFLGWFIVDAFAEKNWRIIVAATLAISLPQFLWRAVVSMRHPDFTIAELHQIDDAVGRVARAIGKQPDEATIRGNAFTWFAHPQHFTALDMRTMGPGEPHTADIVLCFDSRLDPVLGWHGSDLTCGEVQNLPAAAETLILHGRTLHVIPTSSATLQWDRQVTAANLPGLHLP